ncbi:GAD-like domain-containing protein [Absiella sp. AM29-15]|uniref:GAD-like domain-containing protein n=1 Tax=Absiella sp. AM29-15 TaxID=2292278 RepID=UPI0018F108B8|nr:GAD-like domain-containing protein [Absiella sp. AM29-15]
MSENVFEGFKKYKDVDEVILEKYKNILPDEFLEIWKKYGFGTILNGYIKIVNPMDYQDILDASYFCGISIHTDHGNSIRRYHHMGEKYFYKKCQI